MWYRVNNNYYLQIIRFDSFYLSLIWFKFKFVYYPFYGPLPRFVHSLLSSLIVTKFGPSCLNMSNWVMICSVHISESCWINYCSCVVFSFSLSSSGIDYSSPWRDSFNASRESIRHNLHILHPSMQTILGICQSKNYSTMLITDQSNLR